MSVNYPNISSPLPLPQYRRRGGIFFGAFSVTYNRQSARQSTTLVTTQLVESAFEAYPSNMEKPPDDAYPLIFDTPFEPLL